MSAAAVNEQFLADWRLAAERGFGGLWDALGLAPWRQAQQALQQLAQAQAEEAQAVSRYALVASGAWMTGLQRFVQQQQQQQPGDADPLALARLWLREIDAAMHEAMLSDAGLQATVATVRAASRRRLGQQRLVSLAGETVGLPTREEVDAAFREIQELKRAQRHCARAMKEPGAAGKRP